MTWYIIRKVPTLAISQLIPGSAESKSGKLYFGCMISGQQVIWNWYISTTHVYILYYAVTGKKLSKDSSASVKYVR